MKYLSYRESERNKNQEPFFFHINPRAHENHVAIEAGEAEQAIADIRRELSSLMEEVETGEKEAGSHILQEVSLLQKLARNEDLLDSDNESEILASLMNRLGFNFGKDLLQQNSLNDISFILQNISEKSIRTFIQDSPDLAWELFTDKNGSYYDINFHGNKFIERNFKLHEILKRYDKNSETGIKGAKFVKVKSLTGEDSTAVRTPSGYFIISPKESWGNPVEISSGTTLQLLDSWQIGEVSKQKISARLDKNKIDLIRDHKSTVESMMENLMDQQDFLDVFFEPDLEDLFTGKGWKKRLDDMYEESLNNGESLGELDIRIKTQMKHQQEILLGLIQNNSGFSQSAKNKYKQSIHQSFQQISNQKLTQTKVLLENEVQNFETFAQKLGLKEVEVKDFIQENLNDYHTPSGIMILFEERLTKKGISLSISQKSEAMGFFREIFYLTEQQRFKQVDSQIYERPLNHEKTIDLIDKFENQEKEIHKAQTKNQLTLFTKDHPEITEKQITQASSTLATFPGLSNISGFDGVHLEVQVNEKPIMIDLERNIMRPKSLKEGIDKDFYEFDLDPKNIPGVMISQTILETIHKDRKTELGSKENIESMGKERYQKMWQKIYPNGGDIALTWEDVVGWHNFITDGNTIPQLLEYFDLLGEDGKITKTNLNDIYEKRGAIRDFIRRDYRVGNADDFQEKLEERKKRLKTKS